MGRGRRGCGSSDSRGVAGVAGVVAAATADEMSAAPVELETGQAVPAAVWEKIIEAEDKINSAILVASTRSLIHCEAALQNALELLLSARDAARAYRSFNAAIDVERTRIDKETMGGFKAVKVALRDVIVQHCYCHALNPADRDDFLDLVRAAFGGTLDLTTYSAILGSYRKLYDSEPHSFSSKNQRSNAIRGHVRPRRPRSKSKPTARSDSLSVPWDEPMCVHIPTLTTSDALSSGEF